MPATNITLDRSFSALKHIKLHVEYSKTAARFKHRIIMLLVHYDKTDQPNIGEVVMDSIGDYQTKLRVSGRL